MGLGSANVPNLPPTVRGKRRRNLLCRMAIPATAKRAVDSA